MAMRKRKAADQEIVDLARRQSEASERLEKATIKRVIDTNPVVIPLVLKTLRAHGYSCDAAILEHAAGGDQADDAQSSGPKSCQRQAQERRLQ